MACYNGQDVVVNELIECRANVNQVNEKGFAPLHFTAASRHGALCLELLVCNGADVNIKVSEPTMFALIAGKLRVHVVILEAVTRFKLAHAGNCGNGESVGVNRSTRTHVLECVLGGF